MMLERVSHTWLYNQFPQINLILLFVVSPHQKFLFKLLYGFVVVVLAIVLLKLLVCSWHTIHSHVQQNSYNIRYEAI